MFFTPKPLDFIAIGDITTDAFIRLKDPHIHAEVNHSERELCMTFGTKIPYEFVEVIRAVGNSGNAAVSASRLGLQTALVANIGNDQNGRECLASLKKDGVQTDFLKIHRGMETNYHYVLWYGDERTILVKHQPYPYALPEIGKPKWIYLSSLGPAAEKYHDEIADYLEKQPGVRFAFQPGTFQINLGYERLKRLYKKSDIIFCNREEAQTILKTNDGEIKELLKVMRGIGPNIVVITDGTKGAYTFDGNEYLFVPPFPDPKPPYDRTGAGDAFSATVVSALALGKTLHEALSWAPINSMSVVQYAGAQKGLLTQTEIKKWLEQAPSDYGVKKI